MLQLSLVLAIVGGIGFAGITGAAYWRGKVTGRSVATAERNAHWQGVVDTLHAAHRAAVDAENARVRAVEEQWRLARQGADHERERERAANAARVAAVAADRDRLRDELASAASGGVVEADDSLSACRDRADAFGRVLGEALRASAACAADAEDLATGVRTLQRAWPTGEVTQ
jgi:hypothetical protein